MKASEYIGMIQESIDKHGDLDVVVNRYGGSHLYFKGCVLFEVSEVNQSHDLVFNEDGTLDEKVLEVFSVNEVITI